jgi:hypothetical protein
MRNLRILTVFCAVLILTCICFKTSHACGTVLGLVDFYFNSPENHMKALINLHCRAVVEHSYRGTKKEHMLLARVIKAALGSPKSCIQDLAVKTYLMYDNLVWLEGSEIHLELNRAVHQRIGRDPANISARFSYFNFKPPRSYCLKVGSELGSLATGFKKCFGGCKEIGGARGSAVRELIAGGAKAISGRRLNELIFAKRLQKSCKIDPAMKGGKIVTLNGDGVYLRKGPSSKTRAIGQFSKGNFLYQSAKKGGWCRVMTAGCKPGWMACRFLK